MKKQIIIAGASGLIGHHLADFFYNAGYSILTLDRNTEKTKKILPFAEKYFSFEQLANGEINSFFVESDAVINLAGASIGAKRWTAKYKQEIIDSRVNTTQKIVTAIKTSGGTPVLINSSATGYYGNRADEILNENSRPGKGFLAEVTQKWENAAMAAASVTRVVTVRKGFVLANDAPALKKMLLPFKFFAGGPLGTGKQWMPWIHIDDLCRIYQYIIEHNQINGPVNLVSPSPVRNEVFMKKIGKILHRPAFVKTPAIAIRTLLGEQADLVLDSQRVVPEKINKAGYEFHFTDLSDALKDILK